MPLDPRIVRGLVRAVAAAVVAATPASFVQATSLSKPGIPVKPGARLPATSIPSKLLVELADGRKVEMTLEHGAMVGRVLDASGRALGSVPAGKLKLKSGKLLSFDRSGRLTEGEISSQAFLLECDPPPAKCPP